MHKPDVFITLDQFKVFAARVTAKTNFIKSKLDTWCKLCDDYAHDSGDGYDWSKARFTELLALLDLPADSFFASCSLDMQNPLTPQPTQVELFGEEFC